MKKIVSLIIGIAMATAVHAAQVTWAASSISASPSESTSYMAYLVDVTGITETYGTAQSVAEALYKGTFTGTVMYSAAGTYNTNNKIVGIAQPKKDLPTTYLPNTTVQYYSLIFDASSASSAEYYMSTGISGDGTVKTGTISAAGLLTVAHQSQAANTWASVPEPTSGLLMLIGMAGLALRRRRA